MPGAGEAGDLASSRDINQPYIGLTIASIVEKCGDTFNICVISDDSFPDLLPEWSIDLSHVADPIRTKLRNVAMAQVLYQYGGLIVPPSFLCMRSLRYIYDSIIFNKRALVGCLRQTSGLGSAETMPSARFMGCLKGSAVVLEYINYLQLLASTDYTEASNFTAEDSEWLKAKVDCGALGELTARQLGVEDASGNMITIGRLMSPTYIEFSKDWLGN